MEKLALHGGRPVREKPLHTVLGGALIGEEEKRAVVEVIESRSLFRYYGPRLLGKVESFERELAAAVSRPRALAVSSGTAALRTAFAALGLCPGDEVVIPAYAFIACPASAITLGLRPIFAECDDALLLDPEDLERHLTNRTRAILVVHMNGAASRMDAILEIAERRGVPVIEDCAQALGATYLGRPVGSFGALATFSLQYLKVVTCGEGGALATADARLHERAEWYHDLGFRRPGRLGESIVGENLRMGELAGAVALEQIRKLPRFLEIMRARRSRIVKGIREVPKVDVREGADPAGDQGGSLILHLPSEESATFFRKALRAENIGCGSCVDKLAYGYSPVLGMRTAASLAATSPYRMGLCPRTEERLRRSTAIAISPAFSEADADDVIAGIRKVSAHLPE